jgi:hypothetical protein
VTATATATAWSLPAAEPADDWLTRVRRALRVEFAGDVILAVAGGPALMGRSCIVAECRRLAHHGGFCEAHHKRWTAAGRPDIEAWVATAPARSKGLRPLQPCDAPGCQRGRTGAGMCQTQSVAVATRRTPGTDRLAGHRFGAGALLVMLIDSMIPEAARQAGKVAELVTVLGFAVAAALSSLS